MAYLKIEYWNSVDLSDVLYQDGFKNRIYLDVELEKPDHNVTIESDTNGDNKEIPKFRKWEKVYKFECWMQEDLVDAFTFMQIVDSIEVTDTDGVTYIIPNGGLTCEAEWMEEGCLAKVTVSFIVDYAVATACSENMQKGCLCVTDTDILGFTSDAVRTSTTGTAWDLRVFYTSEVIADAKYVGSLWQLQTTGAYDWVLVSVTANSECFEDTIKGVGQWIWDGTYWRLMPGYIISLSYAAPNVWLRGWIPEGMFCTVWYDAGLGWVDGGDYTGSNLEDLGLYFSLGVSGTIPFRLEVWNHSCNYGYTEEVEVIIP